MKKYLTYKDDKSNKFWSIEVSGKSFTVTYGKTGTAGQASTKEFDTEETCMKEAEKLVSEKVRKGYGEDGVSASASVEPSDYMKEWKEIVNSKDLHKALIEHFSYLADSPGYDKVLEAIMKTALSASIEKEYLYLLKIIFSNGLILNAIEPDFTGDHTKWPKSFRGFFSKHLSIEDPAHTLSLTDNGWPDAPVKDWNVNATRCLSPLNDGSDRWVYHPNEINKLGDLRLYKIDHASNSPDEHSELNIGSLFIKSLAELNGILSETDISPESEMEWWSMLNEEWKEIFLTVANIKNKEITAQTVAKIISLKELEHSSDTISDLGPLVKLTELKELEIRGKGIKDIAPICKLVKLKRLSLRGSSGITDISPLTSLSGLSFLDIENLTINNIEALSGLTKMEILDISSTAVSNVEPLSALVNLRDLRINHTKIESLAPLADLKKKGKLKEVSIQGLSKDILKTLW